MIDDVLRLSPRIVALPVLHGNGDFAIAVRRLMAKERFDCVAVPLPPTFQADVEAAIDRLPAISLVVQRSSPWAPGSGELGSGSGADPDADGTVSYVPVDPCQAVIAALRSALEERVPRAFVDLETDPFMPYAAVFPDAYALKRVPLSRFVSALLPSLPPLPQGQPTQRVETMAARLRELEGRFRSILFVSSLLDWPWVRQAYLRETSPFEDDPVEPTAVYEPSAASLYFVLGELPYITGLYERARRKL